MRDPAETVGTLRAWVNVPVVNLRGDMVTRKVTIGTEYFLSIDTARDMVTEARVKNEGVTINAELRVIL